MIRSGRQTRSFAFNRANSDSVAASVSAQAKLLAASWRTWLPQSLLILAATLWIYWPALHGGWIWDDVWYVTTNPLMHGWIGLWKFWYRPGSWVEFYPLQETVQWLQWQMWGNDTFGYHMTNVGLHMTSALLVWRLLGKLGLRQAWLGGLIFAVHPVQVESVALVSELKNTLSLPFFLWSMMAWIDFQDGKLRIDYQRSLGWFLVAMLCKVSMSPFPVVILLYAWWKRERIEGKDVKESVPFFLVAIILTATTLWAGHLYEASTHHLISPVPLDGILSRIDAAGLISTVYFARCFLPVDLIYVYGQWPLHPESAVQYLPWLGWLAVGGWLWAKRSTWGRHGLFGLGFFFIFLAPFLGFISASYMNFIWAMDHLLYIPIIGLIALFVAIMEGLSSRISTWARPVMSGVLACLVVLAAWTSHAFAGLFLNQETFWGHIVECNPEFWLGQDNLGCDLAAQHRYQDSIGHLQKAIDLRPDDPEGYDNLGVSLDKLGQTDAAAALFQKAIALNSEDSQAYLNLGGVDQRKGKSVEAEALFRQGLKIAPNDESLNNNEATILVQSHRAAEAIPLYRRALENDPDSAHLHYNLANALTASGDIPGAVEELEAALALDFSMAQGHENLGVALARLGRLSEAVAEFESALKTGLQSATAHDNLAFALAQNGQLDEAGDQFKLALKLDPQDATALSSLTKLQRFQMQQGAAAPK